MIEVDLRVHNPMFRRAWLATLGPRSGISTEESLELWKNTFGCRMIGLTEKGETRWVTAVFDRDEDYTAFLLKWMK